MQLVAVPTVLVALCVALAAPVAVSRQFLQKLRQGLALLLLELSRLRLAGFALPWTTAFLLLGGQCFWRVNLLRRFLAGLYRRAIPADMAYPPISQRLPHQCRMGAFRQTIRSKFGKGAREGRFARQLLPHREATYTTQGAIHGEAFDQTCRS